MGLGDCLAITDDTQCLGGSGAVWMHKGKFHYDTNHGFPFKRQCKPGKSLPSQMCLIWSSKKSRLGKSLRKWSHISWFLDGFPVCWPIRIHPRIGGDPFPPNCASSLTLPVLNGSQNLWHCQAWRQITWAELAQRSKVEQGGVPWGTAFFLSLAFVWVVWFSEIKAFFFQKRGKVKPASRTMAFDWKKIFWRKVDVNFFHLLFEKPGFSSMFCGSQRRWWRNPSRTLASQAEFLGYV